MEDDETPAWATELRSFTEFTIGRLEQRMSQRFDATDARAASFENRVVRKFDAFDSRLGVIDSRLVSIDSRLGSIESRLGSVEKDVTE